MKNVNESGRSMVEMLGVLAIIGVLSIGGIAGYTMAMNRYRANEIIDAASKLAIVNMTRPTDGTDATLADIGLTSPIAGVACTMTGTAGTGTVVITGDCKTKLDTTIESIAGDKYNAGTFTFG